MARTNFDPQILSPRSGLLLGNLAPRRGRIGAKHEPGNPLANADCNVYSPNVNVIEEMTDMISASRAYQNDVEVMNSAKQLMLKTLELGK